MEGATGRQRLGKSSLQELYIPLPPFPEQRAIAHILQTVQVAKEKIEGVIQAAKELKKSFLKYLFSYGPVPVEYAEKVPLKKTEVGLIPEEWQVVRLGEVAEVIMGQSPPGSTYNQAGIGTPFLQGKAEFGNIFPSNIKYTVKPKKIAPEKSVLISVRAPVGDINIANIPYCIGMGLASLSMKIGDNIFLFYLLCHKKNDIEKEGTGSTFKAINKDKIISFPIPLPPLHIQQRIADILSTVDERIESAENQKHTLETLFKTLLSLLMSGIIRLSWSHD
ncbi:MAG: hypothetical protein GX428_07545 [Candidatus Atribacteria bacterium]|nr:hypothetical protein [Candidatus Atribacteria bacterium]